MMLHVNQNIPQLADRRHIYIVPPETGGTMCDFLWAIYSWLLRSTERSQ